MIRHLRGLKGNSGGPWTPKILTFGDSKTAWGAEWRTDLLANLSTVTGLTWTETASLAAPFNTVASHYATFDADWLAARGAGIPGVILWDLGVNDIFSALVKATWQGQVAYMLDEFHKYARNALIYITYPWSTPIPVTPYATLWTWYQELIAARSGWCFAGDDESIWLQNNDGAASMTIDGIHYSTPAGMWAKAVNVQVAMGYALPNLYYDTFTTPVAAPMPGSVSAEPGPGLRIKVNDTSNELSVAGGVLVVASGHSDYGNPAFRFDPAAGSSYAASEGRVFALDLVYNSADLLYAGPGTDNGGGNAWAFIRIETPGKITIMKLGNTITDTGEVLTPGTSYRLWIVWDGYNVYLFIKGGTWAVPTRIFTYHPASAPALYFNGSSFTAAGTLDKVKVTDLAGPFNNQQYAAGLPANDAAFLVLNAI